MGALGGTKDHTTRSSSWKKHSTRRGERVKHTFLQYASPRPTSRQAWAYQLQSHFRASRATVGWMPG